MPNDAAGIIAPSAPLGAPPAVVATTPPPAVENTTESIPPDITRPLKTTPDESTKVEVVQPKRKTAMDSINAATDKVNKDEAAKAKVAEPSKKDDATTLPKTEAAKTAEPKPVDVKSEPWREAPKRFNDAEKAEWEAAPDSAKQGVHRAIKELEEGHAKYKQDATEYAELKDFKEMAKKANVTLKDALKNYTDLDAALHSNDPKAKLAAIETVLGVAKVTPQEYAAFITKQPQPTADQATAQQEARMRSLEEKNARLEQQLNGVTTNIKTQEEQTAINELNDWAKDKPLAERLAPQIAQHYKAGLPLDEAYAKAEEEFRELAQAAGFIPAQAAPLIPPVAHNPKAQKSISGAPSAGSFPATQKPSKSPAEAVERALAQLGYS